MRHIIMPLNGTFRPNGGMTSSILKKASFLAEIGHNVQLITFRYRHDQEAHLESLVKDHNVSPRVNLINFFEYLDEQSSTLQIPNKNLIETALHPQLENDNLCRYFSDSGDLLYTEFTKDKPYTHRVREYRDQQNKLFRTEVLTAQRKLKHVSRLSLKTGMPISESYISKAGRAYLSIWYGEDNRINKVIDHTGGLDNLRPAFGSLEQLQEHWFSYILSRVTNPILLLDSPHIFPIIRSSLNKTDKNILTLHSNIFKTPDDIYSDINSEHVELMDSIGEFDEVVTSTRMQADDLRSIYVNKSFTPIPQIVLRPENRNLSSTIVRDNNRLIYIGRLEPSKQIPELLEALVPLFLSRPNVQFHIFGEGSQKAKIESRIRKLNLIQNVFLRGITHDSDKEFARSNISVLPTKLEGFGLTIAESMLAGTPVVAFDCRYGPSDMIMDGISGRLIPNQHFPSLYRAVNDLFENQELIDSMRPEAMRAITVLCSESSIISRWATLVEKL